MLKFSELFNFLVKIPILKEFERFEWFEWFEWFGPSPIEPFNSGPDGKTWSKVHEIERAHGRTHPREGPEWKRAAYVDEVERAQSAPEAAEAPHLCYSHLFLTFGYCLANFERLVLGCIEAEVCKLIVNTTKWYWILVWKLLTRSTSLQTFAPLRNQEFS